jgi:hypothetical protein
MLGAKDGNGYNRAAIKNNNKKNGFNQITNDLALNPFN